MPHHLKYRFGEWLVEPELNRLSRADDVTRLSPRAMDILAYLLAHPGELVSTDELLSQFWHDRHGDPGSVQKQIGFLRKALGERPKNAPYIETIRNRGYQTIAPVEVYQGAIASDEIPGDGNRGIGEARSGKKKSIAVLPFVNMCSSADNAFFADGIHEDILSSLTRIPGLIVTSRTSVMGFRQTDLLLPDIGRQLGVKYILEGSVRKEGDRVRITVQLLQADSDRHLWTDSYDRELVDIFAIQSDVARQVARELEVALSSTLSARINEGVTDSALAYEYFLSGRELVRSSGSAAGLERAMRFFEKALELDTDFALAYAWIARTLAAQHFTTVEWADVQDKAFAAANRAYQLDPLDDEIVMVLAQLCMKSRLSGTAEQAYRYVDEALALAPNNVDALRSKYWQLSAAGQGKEAFEFLQKALVVDPLNPDSLRVSAVEQETRGRSSEAEMQIKRALTLQPTPQAYIQTANFFRDKGDHYQQIYYLRESYRLDSGAVMAPMDLARVLQ
jgi:TolB-like protein/Flp pilus assembly protein TadD